MVAASELPINTGASALEMGQTIFGDGTTVTGATFYGNNAASGIFTNGDAISPEATPADEGVILSTGRAQDFTNSTGDANQDTGTSTDLIGGIDNWSGFNNIAGTSTFDGAVLDVNFIPDGDTLTLQFTFASEEYPEYSNSVFNDVVAFWVNGVEAEITVGDGGISVGAINQDSNQSLYIDNTGNDYNTEMDGFTVTLTVKAPVNPGEVNLLRIGIADTSDALYDSNLLIAANSAQTSFIANDDSLMLGTNKSRTIDVLENDGIPAGVVATITHINGIAVSAGDTVTLPTGQTILVNGDGTLTATGDADAETVTFSYTVETASGASDSAFVTLDVVPCFVAGTMILTPDGEVPVETLEPGDLVVTHDEGPQPVRWIGQRKIPAEGDMAPIRFAAGALGDHRTLLVSPQHRILINDGLAELLFGETEVLVPAKFLLNDRTITRQSGGWVTYVHLLFDHHQVVYSEGMATESFQPGPQSGDAFSEDALREIARLFPELDPRTGDGYGRAARMSLKRHEASVLVGAEDMSARRAA